MASAFKLSEGSFESLGLFGQSRLGGLCEALGLDEQERREASGLFDLVSESWANCPLGLRAPWQNDITDDGTPFEFSVGFEAEKPELRLLFESRLPGVATPTLSSWDAGIALQRQLRLRGVGDTSRFDQLAPLLAPRAGQATPRFSLWHALVLRKQTSSLFKAYLNPEVRGVEQAPSLTAQALRRLNLSSCWNFVEQRLSSAVGIPYLSLDLEASAHARVKLYLSATHANQVEALLDGCSNYQSGDARRWLYALTGTAGDYLERPILVCFAFTGEGRAPEGTCHVPVRSYLSSDQEALERTAPLLPATSAQKLEAALNCLALRPLSESRGVLSYVSLRPVGGRVRVTTYLAPGAYSVANDQFSSGTHPTG